MFQPATLALVLVLLGGALAQAQPVPTREPRQRSFTLTGTPLEARIAKGTVTLLVFGVSIRGREVEVDSAQIKVVDTGEHSDDVVQEDAPSSVSGAGWENE